MTVFEAFPNAVETDRWYWYQMSYSQARYGMIRYGNRTPLGPTITVDASDQKNGENPANSEADILLYVLPKNGPAGNTPDVAASWTSGSIDIVDAKNDVNYRVLKAEIGRNDQTNEVEHVELQLQKVAMW